MGGRNPCIPELVERLGILSVGDGDEYLQKTGSVALDRSQCRIDLGEHLSDLATSIDRHILGNFDPVGHTLMHDDVCPTLGTAQSQNLGHGNDFPFPSRWYRGDIR